MVNAAYSCAVIGAGPMGVAAARALLGRPAAQAPRVVLVDRDGERVRRAATLMAKGSARFDGHVGDLADEATGAVIDRCDVVAAALSWNDSRPLLDQAAQAPLQIVTIGRPPPDHRGELAGRLAPGARVVVGAGLEPGLTEILAYRLAVTKGPATTLRLYCGSVPASPRPPLRHLSWYGSHLTISPRPAYRISEGTLRQVPRFSGLELVDVPGLGRLEAFHDGLAPWIADDRFLGAVLSMDQKTLRWPGYAAKVTALSELGLLSEVPVPTADGPARPREVLDAVLAPHITPHPGDTDITLLIAEASGPTVAGGTHCTVVEAVTDPHSGTSGIGRITGGVLAAAVHAIAGAGPEDGPAPRDGVLYPQELFAGRRTDALLDLLRHDGISIADHRHGWVRPARRAHDGFPQTR
jgi:saccharopine dehydrogenase-like NADP-dependent oxidoreductase